MTGDIQALTLLIAKVHIGYPCPNTHENNLGTAGVVLLSHFGVRWLQIQQTIEIRVKGLS